MDGAPKNDNGNDSQAWSMIDLPLMADWPRRPMQKTDPAGKPTGYNCGCHDSNFDLAGNRGEGPSPRGLDPLPVEFEGDSIAVIFKRFRIGRESREEVG